jgi:hypothetical protein
MVKQPANQPLQRSTQRRRGQHGLHLAIQLELPPVGRPRLHQAIGVQQQPVGGRQGEPLECGDGGQPQRGSRLGTGQQLGRPRAEPQRGRVAAVDQLQLAAPAELCQYRGDEVLLAKPRPDAAVQLGGQLDQAWVRGGRAEAVWASPDSSEGRLSGSSR